MGQINNQGFRSLDPYYLSPIKGSECIKSKDIWTKTRHCKIIAARIMQSILRLIPTFLLPIKIQKIVNDHPLNNRDMLKNLNTNLDYLIHTWSCSPNKKEIEKIKQCIEYLKKSISHEKDKDILKALEKLANSVQEQIDEKRPITDQTLLLGMNIALKNTNLDYHNLFKRISIYNIVI